MSDIKTLAAEYAEFVKVVYCGRTLSPEQAFQIKNAFYSGAMIALKTVGDISVAASSEDIGVMEIELLYQEGVAYFREIRRKFGGGGGGGGGETQGRGFSE